MNVENALTSLPLACFRLSRWVKASLGGGTITPKHAFVFGSTL